LPTLLLIPTGIGCSIGGYAGDAIPTARLLAAASGCLITHPNVMNGASLYWTDKRIHYVEGLSIDLFTAGEMLLRPNCQQKVGVLLDKGIESDLLERHIQVVNACRATLGLNIGPIVITDTPLKISLKRGSSGSSWGEIGEVDSLLRAGEKLKESGASAVAIVTRFPDEFNKMELDEYRKGKGVDVLSGAEAVVSHLLVKHLCLPCAHAPAMTALPIERGLDPLAAAEELGHTFLPCVLVGLSRAPGLVSAKTLMKNTAIHCADLLSVDQLGAVIVPDGALGGASVLACIERNIPLIVVSNKNILNIGVEALGLKANLRANLRTSIFHARNYKEAVGILVGLGEGIDISSLDRPIKQTYLLD